MRLVPFALTVIGVLAVAAIVSVKVADGFAWDARAYWMTRDGDLYTIARTTDEFAYLYSPAFAQAMAPLTALPWEVFLPVWTSVQAVALVMMAGPLTVAVLFAEPVWYELDVANVTLLLAGSVVLGFRWPWTWALVAHTKVTPFIGVLWFAFRGEWRSFGIAVGATVAVGLASFVLWPGAWVEWIGVLAVHNATPGFGPPLLLRLPVAVALLWWGARRDARWVVPIAVMLSLPVLRTTGYVVLVACIPLALPAIRARIGKAAPAREAAPLSAR